MSEPYNIGRLNGQFVIVFRDPSTGKRRRYSLGTSNPSEAKRLAPALHAELIRPKGITVKELWDAYTADKAGRAILGAMQTTWKALEDRFGRLPGDAVGIADCRAHMRERRERGNRDWTIYTQLGHLRNVLSWAFKSKLIKEKPKVELPPEPKVEKRRLTREEVKRLVEAAELPHVRLYITLLYTTAARTGALLELTWDRCDFESNRIHLANPNLLRPHKGRAVVPMNSTARQALLEAQQGALTNYVIEWGGHPVKKIRRALSTAARKANLGHVNPHMLRHTAASHMAEDRVPIEEIAQYLGHKSVDTTWKIYARYSPNYLQRAAGAVEL